jgi:hypothetical protein
MERMGHRSTRAVLIYLHARDHRDREIAAGLNRMVALGRGEDEGHAGGTNDDSDPPHDRDGGPLSQVDQVERATGIEPA